MQQDNMGRLEALLFAAGEPLGVPQLAELLGLNKPQTWELLGLLQEEYKSEKRGLELREVAEGWQLCTKACHHEMILQLAGTQELKLSNAAMETLAIVAYRQPVTRTEMEAIRGVSVDGVVNTLLEWELIAEAGRKDTAGRPILYKTTDRFLEVFGLKALKDLPAMPDILAEDAAKHPQQLSLLEMDEAEKPGADTDAVPDEETDAIPVSDDTSQLGEEDVKEMEAAAKNNEE